MTLGTEVSGRGRWGALPTARTVGEERLKDIVTESSIRLVKLFEQASGAELDIKLFGVRASPLHPIGKVLPDDEWESVRTIALKWPMARCIEAAYHYGVNGISEAGVDLWAMNKFLLEIVGLVSSVHYDFGRILTGVLRLSQARFELERPTGSLALDGLAGLAGVDERTVRNAMASGELPFKKNGPLIEFDAADAKQWLGGRKGFVQTKPTVSTRGIEKIQTRMQFGQFVVGLNERLTEQGIGGNAPVDSDVMKQLENGSFPLPLNLVFPLADFFGIRRNAFLHCVMRVHFPEQYALMTA